MRRRSSRQTDASPSLFPFLAVLICTVGALIVLLVVVVQQARVHAGSVAAAPDPDPDPAAQGEQLQQLRQTLLRQLQRLQQSQATGRKQLDADRDALSRLLENVRRRKQTFASLDQTDRQLQQEDSENRRSIAESERALAELKQEIDQAKERLRQSTDGEDAGRPAYAVVPYDGPNETRRRPIYIECLRDRVVLQPEGLTFLTEDFQNALGPNNPLAAALRATRAYLTRVKGMSYNEQAYPLLIVRPDGAEAYAAARAAMRSWDAEFGYELVTADMKLAYPPADPALAQMLQGVVQLARQRQQRNRLVSEALAARVGRRGSSSGFRASGHGGFVPIQGDPDADGWGAGSLTGSSARQFGSRPTDRPGSPWTSPAGQDGGAGAALSGTVASRSSNGVPGPNTGGATGSARNSPWPAAVESRTGSSVPAGAAGGLASVPAGTAGGLASGRKTPNDGQGQGGQRPGDGQGGPVRGRDGQGSGDRLDQIGSPAVASHGPTTGSGRGPGEGQGGPVRGRDGQGPGDRLDQIGSPAVASHGPTTGSGRGPGATTGGDSRGSGPGQSAPGGQSAGRTAGQTTGGAAGTGQRGSTAQGNGQQTGQGSSLAGTPGSEAASSQGPGGTAAGGACESAAGSNGGMGSMQPTLGSSAPTQGEAVTPLARSRGRGWALPNSTQGAIVITRPVTIECQPNRIVLRPEPRTLAVSTAIPFQPSTRSAVQPLVDAIWDRVDSWGIAGPGVHWKPELHVSVSRGAEPRFAQLQALMQESGIGIVRKHR